MAGPFGMIEPVDLFAIVLALAVLIGSVNHLWVKLPAAIGMLLGSLVVSLLVVVSDHVFHLHVMRWFRGTLGGPIYRISSSTACSRFCSTPAVCMSMSRSCAGGGG